MSATYLASELKTELGDIPPTFLPVGNKHLYKLQIEFAKKYYDKIVLTLPSNFSPFEADLQFFNDHHIQVLFLDPNLKIGDSLGQALHELKPNERVDILFGDTLFDDFKPQLNSVAVAKKMGNYNWHVDQDHVWAGFFSFANPSKLAKLLEQFTFHSAIENYISDSPDFLKIPIQHWYDFGHLNTYFYSKQKMTTERHFNCLEIKNGAVIKSSSDALKMSAEAAWYKNAPPSIKPFLPQFFEESFSLDKKKCYSIEYLHLLSLSEIYVFGRQDENTWNEIFNSCSYFLDETALVATESAQWSEKDSYQLYYKKTLDRLAQFESESGIKLDHEWKLNDQYLPSLSTISESVWSALKDRPGRPGFIHGDFCFSNILYDFKSKKIKVIDPRGLNTNNEITNLGDFRYEIAKLAHSAVGFYDQIIAQQYNFTENQYRLTLGFASDKNLDIVKDIFLNTKFRGQTPDKWDILPIMITLFMSMLPLHKDNVQRQKVLIANVLRLYRQMSQ